jgi:hypothetical protein
MVFPHPFTSDDAARGWAAKRAHSRDHPVTRDSAQLLGDARQGILWYMIEDDIVTRDYVEVPIWPGQRLGKVVDLERYLPVAIWIPRIQAFGLLARNFQLAPRDIYACGFQGKAEPLGIDGNSPDPRTGTAASIENAKAGHAIRAKLVNRLANRFPHDAISMRETTWPFGGLPSPLAVGV